MILKSIKLKNFLSHPNTEVQFEDGQSLLISGKSGSGKSSILQAITYVLYNDTRSDSKNMIMKGASSCKVELQLQDKNDIYTIIREYDTKKNKLILLLNDTDITLATMKETQDYLINNILHCSFELFQNSVYIPQDYTDNFARQTPSKRKDLLMEILQTIDFDDYYEKSRQVLNDLSNKLTINTNHKEKIQLDIQNTALKIGDIDTWKKNKEQAVKERDLLLQEKSIYTTKLSELNLEINSIKLLEVERENKLKFYNTLKETQTISQQELEKINSLIVLTDEEINGLVNRATELQKEITNIEEITRIYKEWELKLQQIVNNAPRKQDYAGDIEKLKQIVEGKKKSVDIFCPTINTDCPKLKKELDAQLQYFIDEIKQKETLLGEQNNTMGEFDKKMIDIQKEKPQEPQPTTILVKELYEINNKLEDNKRKQEDKKKIPALEERIKSTSEAMNTVVEEGKVIAQKIESLQGKKSEVEILLSKSQDIDIKDKALQNKINDLDVAIRLSEDAKNNKSNYEQELKEVEQEITNINNNINSISIFKDAVGSNGIKTLLIDSIIPLLEDRINQILSTLSDFSIQLDTQRDSASGTKKIEGLSINVINAQGESLDFNQYSGGERGKLNFSISSALSTFSKFKFLILDEAVQGLDQESISSFMDIVLNLQGNVHQLLCISHIEEIKNLFSEQIEVAKKDGKSYII